jgi:DNA-binding transcriptional MocR family regulator
VQQFNPPCWQRLSSILKSNHQVRSLYPVESTPGIISLLAGKPNPATFPFTSFAFTARSPIDPEEQTVLKIEGNELAQSLQYGPTAGEKQLISWINGLQEFSHGRKQNEGWRVSIGAGSQDLIYKVGYTKSPLIGVIEPEVHTGRHSSCEPWGSGPP